MSVSVKMLITAHNCNIINSWKGFVATWPSYQSWIAWNPCLCQVIICYHSNNLPTKLGLPITW